MGLGQALSERGLLGKLWGQASWDDCGPCGRRRSRHDLTGAIACFLDSNCRSALGICCSAEKLAEVDLERLAASQKVEPELATRLAALLDQ